MASLSCAATGATTSGGETPMGTPGSRGRTACVPSSAGACVPILESTHARESFMADGEGRGGSGENARDGEGPRGPMLQLGAVARGGDFGCLVASS